LLINDDGSDTNTSTSITTAHCCSPRPMQRVQHGSSHALPHPVPLLYSCLPDRPTGPPRLFTGLVAQHGQAMTRCVELGRCSYLFAVARQSEMALESEWGYRRHPRVLGLLSQRVILVELHGEAGVDRWSYINYSPMLYMGTHTYSRLGASTPSKRLSSGGRPSGSAK
jgi:hypothetical protein